ncbi:hypothetical protein [Permianibacter aggregans]|uniref:hypothetical protein n=1 Tax=Permianibacter aggregans TaxID=1510150 RepID=UPI00105BE986|nr:hypothetical protein [Permianibacter aggregans]QGX41021.1 hypothetical protein E2H98_15655 [Permianibacter aggregans]
MRYDKKIYVAIRESVAIAIIQLIANTNTYSTQTALRFIESTNFYAKPICTATWNYTANDTNLILEAISKPAFMAALKITPILTARLPRRTL